MSVETTLIPSGVSRRHALALCLSGLGALIAGKAFTRTSAGRFESLFRGRQTALRLGRAYLAANAATTDAPQLIAALLGGAEMPRRPLSPNCK